CGGKRPKCGHASGSALIPMPSAKSRLFPKGKGEKGAAKPAHHRDAVFPLQRGHLKTSSLAAGG
ncbi:hypothetical protein, partial [uncultured Bilophila sp.]|uniref:hypothetical protein n=1 Tax=uncultured Bilophila sp. TaxID=529385 RepID=UPI0026383DE4